MQIVGLSGNVFNGAGLRQMSPYYEVRWAWVTITLSILVAAAYAAIAINWYLLAKVPRSRETRRALSRLRIVFIACLVLGYAAKQINMSWGAWRIYDAVLLILACESWRFALRLKGMTRVDERLAQTSGLEESARQYREIAELLPQMVWTATGDGRIDYSNRQWSGFAGRGQTWLEAVHPGERDGVRTWWRGAVESRQAATREVRLCGSAGDCRTFVVSAIPIVRGDAVRWLGACTDVEDQKLLAIEKERQCRQKLFFLNSLSHDLRAPLNNVALNAQLLRTSLTDRQAIARADTIMENAIAAADLVTRLLDFAKLGTDDGNHPGPVRLFELLGQIVRRFEPLAAQRELYVRLRSQGDLEIQTDRLKLERVISNLVDNALKYTQRGGVELSARLTGQEIAVRVADTGMGIPPECVPHLFDEFYQVNNHERDGRKGFGLGLAICAHLARQLGGDIRLARTGDDGSCFEVAVPAAPRGAAGGGRPDRAAGDLAAPAEAWPCSV